MRHKCSESRSDHNRQPASDPRPQALSLCASLIATQGSDPANLHMLAWTHLRLKSDLSPDFQVETGQADSPTFNQPSHA
ncbi:hypothetical protein C7S18_13275 [Ahniella affigens]|uniref:Uncharacterized protein n=1 Tax=Ahniella affigens TaxID=2021234 RepID=A0A2P1PTE5_9GAMM|nr:hypothetical protein C7S18_13275 [Ahniella affigens]